MAKKKEKVTIKEELKDPKKRKKYIVIAIAFLLFIGLASLIPSDSTDTDKAKDEESSEEEDIRLAVEDYCQDAGLLRKYISDRVSIISMSNYNDQYNDAGIVDGKHEYWLSWNGKNKDTNELVHFVCGLTGEKGDFTLESLNIDGVQVYDRKALDS